MTTIDFGVRANDTVTIPAEWSNLLSGLPSGRNVAGRVRSVNGPVATIETQFGDVKIATVSVIKMCN
jgi:hypothetical protein